MLNRGKHSALLLFTVYCLLSIIYCSAQVSSLSPTLISATGNYSSAGGISISSSVGEPIVTTTPLVGGIQLTQGFQQPSPSPLSCSLTVSINAMQIAVGNVHSLALKNDGTVWAWGWNVYGQLGNGTNTDSNVPVQVTSLTGIIAIAGGEYFSLALKNDGTVWAWGKNLEGQLGNGTNTDSNVPVQVNFLTGVIAIAGGSYHSLALKNDGTVWAWGRNLEGQLGNGNNTDSNVPVLVSSLTGVIAIAGRGSHSLALKNDGMVWAWGYNFYGQLGNGNNTDSNVPVQVTALTGIIAIAGGAYHSLALKNDGTVWAWGWNVAGQLGNGTTTDSNVPVPVSFLTAVTAIAGGEQHSIALKNDGTAWTWGQSSSGQLGNGTTTDSSVPVPVSSLTGIIAVAAGVSHCLAIKNDGTAWTWGRNIEGQLGNGTFTNSNVPVQSGINTSAICSGSSVTLTATVSNGSAPYTYLWSTNESTSSIIVTPTGTTTYSVVASDLLCSDTAYSTVVVNPIPTITVTYSNGAAICLGDSSVLTASGGTSYLWLNAGQTTDSITVSPASFTIYNVTGTNSFGCADTVSYMLTVNTPPIASISGSITICSGNGTTLTDNVSGGAAPYTYVWSDASITSAIFVTPSALTSYSVLTTDVNGCSATATHTVTVNPSPTLSAGSSPDTICSGQNTNIEALVTGGAPPYTYSWSPSSQTTSSFPVTLTSTATYSVTVFGLNGCATTATTVVTVNPIPTVTISPNNPIICNGQNTTLTAGGANSYAWSSAGGLSCTTCSNPIANPPATMTYTVTGTSLGCPGTKTVTVTVNPTPTVTVTNPLTICGGSSATLTANTNGTSYLWNPGGQTTSSITVSPTFQNSYTITASIGSCSATATASVTGTPPLALSVTTTSITCNAMCNGTAAASVTGGYPGYTYSWAGGQTTSAAVALCAGNYSLMVTDALGCTITNTVAITQPTPLTASITVTPAANTTICSGQTITLDANATSAGNTSYSYKWLPGGHTTKSITDTPANTSTYTVTVTDGNGCSDTATATVNVNSIPTVSVTASADTICAGFMNTDTLTASGGTSYLWTWAFSNTTINPLIVSPITTGFNTYNVAVTDSNGCSKDTAISIYVKPKLSPPVVTPDNSSYCFGDSIKPITASPTNSVYGIIWMDALAPPNIVSTNSIYQPPQNLPSGSSTNYWAIQYADLKTCRSPIATATITINPLPMANISVYPSVPICSGNSATLTAAASGGGGGPYTYSWSNGPTTSTYIVSPTTSTGYTVTVTDSNSCSKDKSVFVSVVKTPTVSITATDSSICSGTPVTLTAKGGTGVTTYLWNNVPPGTTSSIIVSPTASATYSVIASNGGCSDIATILITVNSVTVTAGSNSPVCAGNTISLTSGGGTIYEWSGPNSYTSSFQNPSIPNATASNAGIYTVIVTDSIGCTGTTTHTIIVLSPPTVSVTSTYNPVCTGSQNITTLTATGGSSYSWSPSSYPLSNPNISNPTVFFTSATPSVVVYTVTVTNTTNGCTKKGTIPITVKPEPPGLIVNPDSYSYCLGDSILPIMVANQTSNIFWAYQTQPTIPLCIPCGNPYTPKDTTASYYVVQGVPGCLSNPTSVSVTINPLPVVSISDSTTICPGSTAQLSVSPAGNTYTYEWFYNSWDSLIPHSNSANISVNPDSTSIYIAGVFDENGCWDKDTVKVAVEYTPNCSRICDSIYNGITPNGDGYNDGWWIDGIRSFPSNRVFIFNRWGDRVWQHGHYDNDAVIWRGTNENGEKLPSGTYYYVIEIYREGEKTITCSGWIEVTQ